MMLEFLSSIACNHIEDLRLGGGLSFPEKAWLLEYVVSVLRFVVAFLFDFLFKALKK